MTMTKRVMREFRLSEISAVDNPAQAHAKMTIIKRADTADEYWKRDFTAEQRRQLADEGKAKPDGSYPIVTRGDLANAIHAWGRGGATASDKEWIIRRAKALGATDALPDNWVSKSADNGGNLNEVESMTTEELNKVIADAVTAATADLTKKLEAQAALLAKATDKKKPPKDDSATDGLAEPDADDASKALWRPYVDKRIAKAVEAAKAEVNKAHAEDEVIKVGDVEFRKSQTDPSMFAVIKAQQAQIAEGVEKAELAEFAKKAEGADFGALPGETMAKAKVLKAVSKLEKDTRETIEKMLKGGNAAMKQGFSELGKRGAIEGSADDKLDQLAKAHANEKKIPYAKAYEAILESPEGRELYAQHRTERHPSAAH